MIDKPQPGEYAPFAAGYIALVSEGDVTERLEQQQQISFELFSQLSDEKAGYAYADGKWTIKEVLGHLIDAERVFVYRAMCIARGEQQSLPGFEQDDYVAQSAVSRRNIREMAEEFKILREANLYFVKSLSTEQANRLGMANSKPTSVRALIHIMAGHELHHLIILKERYL
jgi:uncharacterized damage-inducible protein DinB